MLNDDIYTTDEGWRPQWSPFSEWSCSAPPAGVLLELMWGSDTVVWRTYGSFI